MKRPLCIAMVIVAVASSAAAQTTPPVSIRGFADGGFETFTANDSFAAVFGHPTGPLFGGGVDVLERHGFFAQIRASRFRRTGERVFVFNDEVFKLGVPATVTITPLELSFGYRIGRRVSFAPYVAGGVGWHRYEETSKFAQPGEDVKQTSIGYQVLGGGEFRVWRWIGVAAEAQWSTVPNALGQNPNSVSAEFHETNLGGTTVRIKLLVGR